MNTQTATQTEAQPIVHRPLPAPVAQPVTVYAPVPMEPTPYASVPPPELYSPRPALTTEHLALLMAAQQYGVQPAPLPEPVDTRVSGRAKGAALVAVSVGSGIGAGAVGVGYATKMIASASSGLMTAALALAIATGSVFFLTLLFKGGRGSAGGTHITQNVTQTVTATGLFGRASGTINR